jgi:hypothetical protein
VHALDDASARIVAAKMARCIGVDRVRIETDGAFVREEPLHNACRPDHGLANEVTH